MSYDEESLCWIIGNDRVSLALQKADDVRLYPGDNLFEVRRAAECFFDALVDLKEAEVDSLKSALYGFTLVGKYVGDYEIQQVIRYPRSDIYFYALVPNTKDIECYPPEEAFNFFYEHRLKYLNTNTYSNLKTPNDIIETIYDRVKDIEQANIEEEDMGSVFFLVLEKGDMQKVIGTF